MFLLRSASPEDRPALLRLAKNFDTVNLPADAAALDALIAGSLEAFARPAGAPPGGTYLFVLEAPDGTPIGTSMILAAHGTPEDPHSYFRVQNEERYSHTLERVFRHETLTFRQSFTPHTEIGGLVLDPAYRSHPRRLGVALSFVRFFYMGLHPERFHDRVQAELLPPFEADGTSRLWEWIGRRFTGLDYRDADRLSRTDREFMTALFPRTPLYTSLMPEEVRAVIGQSGQATRGAERMLRSIGFHYNRHVDPFDGGPHFEAKRDDISVLRAIVRGQALAPPADAPPADAPTGAQAQSGTAAGVASRTSGEGAAASAAPLRTLLRVPPAPAAAAGAFACVDVDAEALREGEALAPQLAPDTLARLFPEGRTDALLVPSRDRERVLAGEKGMAGA